jgi:hypothetical protein
LNHTDAQVKQKPQVKPQATPIVYQSFWGPMKNGFVSLAQVKASSQSPIIIRDNSNGIYEVIGFRISYKFKGSIKDEQSGEIKPVNDLRVGDFSNTNVLPAPWFESIRDNAKEGDEILFSKIIFKNSSGKHLLAPDIKITIR